jgi:hypothetical protein
MRKIKENREKMYRSRWTKIVSYILVMVMTVSLFGQVAANGTFDGTGKQAGTGTIAEISQVEAASDTAIDYKAVLKETSAAIEKTLEISYEYELPIHYEKNKKGEYEEVKRTVKWWGPAIGSIGGEWTVIGECRYGMENAPWYRAYYNNITEYIKATYNINKEKYAVGDWDNQFLKLHKTKSTENSRIILALTSMGLDASDIEGYDLTGALSDMTYVKKQGLNGPIWALIALDSGNYEIPQITSGKTTAQVSREKLLSYILSSELTDGGFNLTKSDSQGADPDVTAMALQAFAPYYTGRITVGTELQKQIREAVDRNIQVLSDMQKTSGAYSSYGSENAESTAQVLVALSSLGIDGRTDSRFVKNGKSVLDGLLYFYISSTGMFKHVDTEKSGNQMATEQSFYALVAYQRFRNKKATLYDMTDADKACVMDLTDCSVTISKTAYIYTGKTIRPAVTVTCKKLDGTTITLKKDTDYTVTYKNNKMPGKATVVVKGKGDYTGSVSRTITIAPMATVISSVTNTETGIRLKWKKTTGAEKYIIYRKAGNGSWKKYKSVKAANGCSFTDTKVTNGSKYAYKIRAYADGVYGAYSSIHTIYRVKQPALKVKKAGKGRLKCSWKKNTKANSYQIMYGTKASMQGAKTIAIKKAGTVKKTITGLKAGKKYYVRIRSCKTVNKKKYYSSWSKTVNIRA